MKVDNSKLQIALATACVNPYDLCKETGIQYQTYNRIARGYNCKPATVGRIAKALNVAVCDLLELESD
jgi:putative transcriptional regulator